MLHGYKQEELPHGGSQKTTHVKGNDTTLCTHSRTPAVGGWIFIGDLKSGANMQNTYCRNQTDLFTENRLIAYEIALNQLSAPQLH